MRLIDADAFKENIKCVCDAGGWLEPVTTAIKEYICKQVDYQTTVDAVEVVRCHKCIHWDEDTVRRNSNDATWWNEAVCRKYSDDIWDAWKDADWFCADGERRSDG